MSPVNSPIKGSNTHSYPAFDYPVGIGTGLVAVKSGVIRDMPGVATRQLFSGLQNGQAWPEAGGGSPNSGNVLVIDHGNNEYTAYLHVSPYHINLLRGKAVKQGGVFGYSGNNGWSTGPHLHFEVWRDGQRIDPGAYLVNIKKESDMGNVAELADLRLKALNDVRYGVGLPAKESNTAEDIIARTQLVAGDVRNLWLDTFGRAPTSEEVVMIEKGPKDFLYFFQSVVKKELDGPVADKPQVLAPGKYQVN